MRNSRIFIGVAASLVACAALANDFVVDSSSLAKGARSGSVLIGFSGDGSATDVQMDVNYDAKLVAVEVKAIGSATCSNPRPGLIRVISPDQGGKALEAKVTPYCNVTVKALQGNLPAEPLKASNALCGGVGGAKVACGTEAADLQGVSNK